MFIFISNALYLAQALLDPRKYTPFFLGCGVRSCGPKRELLSPSLARRTIASSTVGCVLSQCVKLMVLLNNCRNFVFRVLCSQIRLIPDMSANLPTPDWNAFRASATGLGRPEAVC